MQDMRNKQICRVCRHKRPLAVAGVCKAPAAANITCAASVRLSWHIQAGL